MVRLWRAAKAVGFLAAVAASGGWTGCAGVKPRPDGHATCSSASTHRASLGCKFQDGFISRCSEIGSTAFNDCVYAATDCGAIDHCDPALQTK